VTGPRTGGGSGSGVNVSTSTGTSTTRGFERGRQMRGLGRTGSGGRPEGGGPARPGRRLLCSAAALGLGLTAALSACGSGTATIGVKPTAAPVQVGEVITGTPAPAATGSGACRPEASSLAPNDVDVDGATLQKIRQRGRLIVGVSQDEDLTGFLDPSTHQEAGFDVDVAAQVAQAIFGAPGHIQFVAVTDPERISYVMNGTVDMTVDTMTINCERLQQVAFSSVYYEAQQKLLVLKDSGITSMAQLTGQKVCAATGSTSIATIQNSTFHPIAYGVTDFSDCLVALQQNQAAAASTDDTILAGLALQDPNLKVVGQSLESEPYGIAVSQKSPDLEEFINGVLATMRSDGTWETIYDKWLAPYLGPALPPTAQYSD
jgi:polar amino acid transport system substrate-binding protein